MQKIIFILFLLLISCDKKEAGYIKPYLSSKEMLDSFRQSGNYSIEQYLKIASSINIASYSKTDFFDSLLKTSFTKYVLVDKDRSIAVMIWPENYRLSNRDKGLLNSLVNSKQICFPTISRGCSNISMPYSTIGNEALYLLLKNDSKFHKSFLRSTDLLSLNKDSLLREIKD